MATSTEQIQQLYIALYGRPADPAGQAYWGNILATDPNAIPTIAATFAQSAEYGATFGGKSNAQIVTTLYQNLFGHSPDASQMAQWTGRLDQGANVGVVINGIMEGASATDRAVLNAKVGAAIAFTSVLDTQAEAAGYSGAAGLATGKEYVAYVDDPETMMAVTTAYALSVVSGEVARGAAWSLPDTVAHQVQELYVAYFSRAAEPAGYDYWTDRLDGDPANPLLQAISNDFSESTEYRTAYSQSTSARKVAAVYENLFSRTAEQAGIDFWAPKLDAGVITLDNVVTEIAKGAQGTDLYAFRAKVDVAQAITEAIDTPAEIQAYSGATANAKVADYIAAVRNEATFNAAIAPGAINNLVASLSSSGSSAPPAGSDNVEFVGVPMSEPALFMF